MISSLPKQQLRLEHPQFNSRWLRRNNLFVIDALSEQILILVAEKPDDEIERALSFALSGRPYEIDLASIEVIEGMWMARDTEQRSSPASEILSPKAETHLAVTEDLPPAIAYVARRLGQARRSGSSDVHIELRRDAAIVRQRVDGRLLDVDQLETSEAHAIVNRIKIMSGLDLAESRKPQDGRLQFQTSSGDVDVRVSTAPGVHGESVVLRLLGQGAVALDLAKLGLADDVTERLERQLEQPNGIIIATGPTGSGKTTTLYAALERLRRPENKILTVEDPVEILMDGLTQVAVRPSIGLTFASALRSFLRQDPDILMVGEIRDGETAEIAMRAAMTGHLVLTTLHTNSAVDAFARLRDIGTEPYLAAASVNAVLAQRLVRTLCPQCRMERTPTEAELERFASYSVLAPPSVFDAQGCDHCGRTGFAGRAVIAEIIELGDIERSAVRDGNDRLLREAIKPRESLPGRGLALVVDGRTSMQEALRVAG